MKNNINVLRMFKAGAVVVEKESDIDDNIGHVKRFVLSHQGIITIRVQFANGDCYNLEPDELELL